MASKVLPSTNGSIVPLGDFQFTDFFGNDILLFDEKLTDQLFFGFFWDKIKLKQQKKDSISRRLCSMLRY